MAHRIDFTLDGEPFPVEIAAAYAAGYTGRDQTAVQEHTEELRAQGIAPPPHVPMLYPLMPTLLTTSQRIHVLGDASTPEVEVAFVRAGGRDYVTVCSDQTDRRAEAVSIPQAKVLCPKPLGGELWRLDDVRERWDSLELRSSCGGQSLQAGALSKLMAPDDLFAFVEEQIGSRDDTVILGGTVPTQATPPAESATIELALADPASSRTIEHAYAIEVMRPFFGQALP